MLVSAADDDSAPLIVNITDVYPARFRPRQSPPASSRGPHVVIRVLGCGPDSTHFRRIQSGVTSLCQT